MNYIKSITWPKFNRILKELGIITISTSIITGIIVLLNLIATYLLGLLV